MFTLASGFAQSAQSWGSQAEVATKVWFWRIFRRFFIPTSLLRRARASKACESLP
jgi:hypothetical protein